MCGDWVYVCAYLFERQDVCFVVTVQQILYVFVCYIMEGSDSRQNLRGFDSDLCDSYMYVCACMSNVSGFV